MARRPVERGGIVGGVDTHRDLHTAAVVTLEGTVLGTESFPTTRAGYRAMPRWFRSHGRLLRVGVESTGSYGAGIARHLGLSGVPVLEVTGPDPAARRARGKDDALDAVAAAEAARTGCRVQVAKDRGGAMEAPRVLRTTRKTAVKSRRAAPQQLHNTIVAAPDEVRDRIRDLTRMRRLRVCAAWRPDATRSRDPAVATRLSLKSLARGVLALDEEIAALDRHIAPLVEELAPDLLALEGVGVASAGEPMVAAGENPGRLRSEASFAMLCGACPLPASSGKTRRHRLNRGGNRQANSALHMIVVCRMRTDQRTRDYVERRTREGLSKREVMRCLKRYVAREVYRVLTAPPPA
ncbi:IS110 family transposase [Candidatus Palauibacter sp.]|uniref:IS110 family transposase n=1 Tax=Candidatus Palauibacter sp. TaxID=3101350 RepID=UPI003B5CBFE7